MKHAFCNINTQAQRRLLIIKPILSLSHIYILRTGKQKKTFVACSYPSISRRQETHKLNFNFRKRDKIALLIVLSNPRKTIPLLHGLGFIVVVGQWYTQKTTFNPSCIISYLVIFTEWYVRLSIR